jgi:uroporphyrinogen decarboxylase
LEYLGRIIAGLKRAHAGVRIPNIVFTKGGGGWLENIAAIGCDAVGLDWTIDIGAARARVGDRVALQGNLDPAVLLSTPLAIEREARAILASYGNGSGHIFNLGHGISQHTPPENVSALIEAVRGSSGRYH